MRTSNVATGTTSMDLIDGRQTVTRRSGNAALWERSGNGQKTVRERWQTDNGVAEAHRTLGRIQSFNVSSNGPLGPDPRGGWLVAVAMVVAPLARPLIHLLVLPQASL